MDFTYCAWLCCHYIVNVLCSICLLKKDYQYSHLQFQIRHIEKKHNKIVPFQKRKQVFVCHIPT